MRTIASTFRTWEEAEAARGRLQRIGVAPDQIAAKDLGEAGGGGAGIFVSAKVEPAQVEAATEILKGGGGTDGGPAAAAPTASAPAAAAPAAAAPQARAGAASTAQAAPHAPRRGMDEADRMPAFGGGGAASTAASAHPPAQVQGHEEGDRRPDFGIGAEPLSRVVAAPPASPLAPARARPDDWRRSSRTLVIFALLLLAAFVIGALLGLVT